MRLNKTAEGPQIEKDTVLGDLQCNKLQHMNGRGALVLVAEYLASLFATFTSFILGFAILLLSSFVANFMSLLSWLR